MKRTYQPKKKHRKRSHGFRIRMKSRTGRRVLSARRLKKRKRLTIWAMLPAPNRLRREQDFSYVYKKGRRIHGHGFSIFFLPHSQNASRFGFVISKKIIPKSTARNRVKRILRAVIQQNLKRIKSGYDVIIQARLTSKTEPPAKIREELVQIIKQAKLLWPGF